MGATFSKRGGIPRQVFPKGNSISIALGLDNTVLGPFTFDVYVMSDEGEGLLGSFSYTRVANSAPSRWIACAWHPAAVEYTVQTRGPAGVKYSVHVAQGLPLCCVGVQLIEDPT